MFDNIYEFVDNFIIEASTDSRIIVEKLYPKIDAVLSTSQGDKKFKQLVGNYMDRNSVTLHKSGPTKMIPFGDNDKAMFYQLFNIDEKEVKGYVKEVTSKLGITSDFLLLTNNPMFWIFYCCIRYYTLKKDTKGINTALAIYALSVYPSVFSVFFKYGANEGVMQYTIDHLSEKYLIKQGGHLFGGLFLSIQHSYSFLAPSIKEGADKDIIRFIQRIRNDQKSMIKNICSEYMKNHSKGLRVALSKDSSTEEMQFDPDAENNTTTVEVVSTNITNQILTNGLDLRRVTQCKDIANIGLSDCRYYLSKVISVKYTDEIEKFVHAILFLYLYDEKKTKADINSTYFLKWSAELFRKTNSNNLNIKTVKDTLDKWGQETGVHDKFKREASRVNYKKAMFWYFILSIQYYNK